MYFYFLVKIWLNNTGKDLSKTLNGKYNQKFIDHAKQCATHAFNTASIRVIQKISSYFVRIKKNPEQTGNNGTKGVKIMVPLKYLSSFQKVLEMALINSEINLQLTCSAKQFLVTGTVANQESKLIITDTKLYVPVVTISTQNCLKNY